ncbi:P-loop NTPase fold protein [Enterobacter roggenkampii]|uniref:P-loop NTPase fold protein n=1 Tax=Enterobacter roggenkampii TaxID=1812935 RepID=UPI002B1F5643|nr:P-loop NTPase fold protein [Enterobacter roggenkampii]MEA5196954.1 P-loop NTPase fold protein [Enterobacter roggenkampii]
MTLQLQTESPADQDLFRGSSHEKVAENMAQVIKTPNVNIIGLEGELGSGKSTILQFLQKQLVDEFSFINFDAERYHHGSTKKALIDVIHKGISQQCPESRIRLDKFKNQALGNIVEYDKKVSSRLSWLTVIFILLSLLSVQMLRYVLTDLNDFFANEKPLVWWLFIAEMTAFLSPGLMVVCLALVQNRGWYRKRGYTNVGDLFKRNSTDRIEETWIANKEVGAIELSDALRGFTSKEVISEGTRFILIIDNLDRISADKVKELWSDMELIAGATHEHFRIVVPYSARQVSASLSVAGFSGREFIAKRIPVSFQVPPLISAGWQEAFRQYWKETVDEDVELACNEATVLLERWRPVEYPRITPRLMKKFVNDIHILSLTVPSTEKYRHILIALYLLVVRYGDRDIKVLLRDPRNNQAQPGIAPDDFDEMLTLTILQISRIFDNDTARWSEFLMSIHYQSTTELARSELLDIPLKEAISSTNGSQLAVLVDLWGFSEAWQRIAPQIQMRDWLVTVTQLEDSLQALVEAQISIALQTMNQSFAVLHREKFDEVLIHSLKALKTTRRMKFDSFIERQVTFLVDKLDEVQNAEQWETENAESLLQEANLYSGLVGESLLEKMSQYVDGVYYASYLAGQEHLYPDLAIETLDIGYQSREQMLFFASEQTHVDLFNPGIIRHITLISQAMRKVIEAPDSANISSVMNALKNRQAIDDIIQFRKIILSTEWNNNTLNSYYLNNSATRELYRSEFAAQAIAHMVLRSNYSGIESFSEHQNEEEFDAAMMSYMRYLNSAERIFRALQDNDVLPYIKTAVCRLLNSGLMKNIPVLNFIQGQYDVIRNVTEDTDPMALVQTRQQFITEKISETDISKLGEVFLHDLYHPSRDMGLLTEHLNEKTSLIFKDPSKLIEAFSNLHPNSRFILEQMSSSDSGIVMENSLGIFASWFRDATADELSRAVNIHFLWSCLEFSQREIVLSDLHDVLLERHIRIDNRIAIINSFHNELSFVEPQKGAERRAIAALFVASVDNPVLCQWLDKQSFTFSLWPQEDARTAVACITTNAHLFPMICSTSQYIKNRITKDNKDEPEEEDTLPT